MENQSILRNFLPQIVDVDNNFIHTEVTSLRQVVLDFLKQSKGLVREHDRLKMMSTAQTIQSLSKLQQYIYNSLLIYEGQGTVDSLKR